MKFLVLFLILLPMSLWGQSSMRRCTLLPITDSVGGAIGFKVYEELENDLKQSNWCTYVSNSGLISVFSKYRENLPQYLKSPEVLQTVAQKLQVGSLIRVSLVNEVRGVETQLEVYGENGEDLYFSEKTLLNSDDVTLIAETAKNWLDTYVKTIPYDAKINGILGDQITLDVGKGYPINVGQTFVVKRPINKKKHPLLKKIVDWETEILAEGKVHNVSDNQALGMVKVYKTDKKLAAGDWVRLDPFKQDAFKDENLGKEEEEKPGSLGILSVALFGSSTSVDTNTPNGSTRMSGNLFGIDLRGEGWITRQYFAALELSQGLGKLNKASGNPDKDSVNMTSGYFKLTGGYKYLPIGFFYGPQIDIYGGIASYTFDMDVSEKDGFGKGTISGLLVGVAANVPIDRLFRFHVRADFLPFPSFKDEDGLYSGSAKSVSALDLELGIKYQYTPRITLDGAVQTFAGKAKFSGNFKEISYHDNVKLKLGASFNF